jgi:hypothetical protein
MQAAVRVFTACPTQHIASQLRRSRRRFGLRQSFSQDEHNPAMTISAQKSIGAEISITQ